MQTSARHNPADQHEEAVDSGTSDPLVGTREETDSVAEDRATPDEEVTLRHAPDGAAVKSRAVAGWLGVFLGGLGAHRFYLGYHAVGMVQASVTLGAALVVILVSLAVNGMSWGGTLLTALGVAMVGVLWGLFEGIAILLGGLDCDAMHRPLRGASPNL